MITLLTVLSLLFAVEGSQDQQLLAKTSHVDPISITDSITVATQPEASFPSWNLMPVSPRRAQFWTNVGFGAISEQYDGNSQIQNLGDQVPLPTSLSALAAGLGLTLPLPEGVDGTVEGHSARLTGTINVVNAHVGGSYNVISRPTYSVSLGADLGLSQQNFQGEELMFNLADATVDIPALGYDDVPLAAVAEQLGLEVPASAPNDTKVESGFQMQSLMFFGELKRSRVSARAGYQLDIGPDPDMAQNRRESTDRQNAFVLGASGRYPISSVVLFGGVDTYLTLQSEAYGYKYDKGDVYGLSGGIGYDLGFGEIGAALTYRYRTDGTYVVAFGEQVIPSATASGYHLGIAPYVNISPNGAAYSLYFKGGVQDEYRDYTMSLGGESEFAPQLGATFGIVYGF